MRRHLLALLAGLLVVAGSPFALAASPAAPVAEARTWGDDPLDEVYAAANAVDRCGLNLNQFVAAMLAPSWPETGAPDPLAPSPMTLSRWDNQSALYAFGNAATPYRRAFWHPGIGLWQFDSAGLGAPYTASQRADIRVMATSMASTISYRYCRGTGTPAQRLEYAWTPWHGCNDARCLLIFAEIYSDGALRNVNRDAGVTNTGGVVQRTCRGPGVSGSFPCWRVDPSRAQGYGAGSTAWADPAYGGSATAPLSAPFYTYAAGGFEYRHWLRSDTGYSSGVWARRPLGQNARSSLRWAGGESLCDVSSGAGACCPLLPSTRACAPVSVAGSYQPVAGDFNGDGVDDIVWYAQGQAQDYLWQGTVYGRFVGRQITANGTYTPVAGDFDGNGTDDILWYKPGGTGRDDVLWRGKRNGSFRGESLRVGGTFVPVAGDVNKDGRDDIFWYGDGTRPDYLWLGSRGGFASRSFTQNGTGLVPLMTDFDKDRRADIFFYGPDGTPDEIWYGSVGPSFQVRTTINVGGSYLPVAGRLDRGGRADVLWYAPGTASDVLYLGARGRSFAGRAVDIDGVYVPFAGDFNGNGVDDVFWYGPGDDPDALTLG